MTLKQNTDTQDYLIYYVTVFLMPNLKTPLAHYPKPSQNQRKVLHKEIRPFCASITCKTLHSIVTHYFIYYKETCQTRKETGKVCGVR